jgi:hypothetical protein
MTDYLVFREVEGKLDPLGTVDANSPEHAVRKIVHSLVEEDAQEVNGTYFSAPAGSTARIEIRVEPSIKITLDSDRVVRPRAPRTKKTGRRKA